MTPSGSPSRARLCRLLRGGERPLLGGQEPASEEAGHRSRQLRDSKRREFLVGGHLLAPVLGHLFSQRLLEPATWTVPHVGLEGQTPMALGQPLQSRGSQPGAKIMSS